LDGKCIIVRKDFRRQDFKKAGARIKAVGSFGGAGGIGAKPTSEIYGKHA
jgi:hypothetical protein